MDILMTNLFGHGSKRIEEGGAHDEFYESAFTYNTEREFANTYTSIDTYNNTINGEGDRPPRRPLNSHPQGDPPFATLVELLCCLLSGILILFTLPFSLLFALKLPHSYERLVIFRMGRLRKVAGPGAVLVLPCVDRAIKVDIRASSIQIPPINLISADKGIVEIESVAFVQINDPISAVCNVLEHEQIIRNIAYTTMYNNFVREMISDLSRPSTQSKILLKVRETVNDFIRDSGVEVIEISISKMNVVKDGENQTIGLFQQIMTSDMGKQLLGALGSHAAEFLMQTPKSVNTESVLHSMYSSMSGANPNSQFPPQQDQNAPVVKSHPVMDSLIEKIRQCCDANLVARIGRFYRINCELDGNVYTVDLNLRYGDGYCALSDSNLSAYQVDATFTLNYPTLISLIREETSAISAYLNGSVKIVGNMEDAMLLKHLFSRAKELNLVLS